jgi:hypothetical protein
MFIAWCIYLIIYVLSIKIATYQTLTKYPKIAYFKSVLGTLKNA